MFKKKLEGFKSFALKGNVFDLAVGVIIGGAFGKIVTSLVNDIVMPPIGVITRGVDFSDLSVTLKQATETAEAVTLNYGAFLTTILDFLIISIAIYIAIQQFHKLQKNEEEKAAEAPQEPSEEVLLLREIRDSLKKSKSKTQK